jgi:hypothetical protein
MLDGKAPSDRGRACLRSSRRSTLRRAPWRSAVKARRTRDLPSGPSGQPVYNTGSGRHEEAVHKTVPPNSVLHPTSTIAGPAAQLRMLAAENHVGCM